MIEVLKRQTLFANLAVSGDKSVTLRAILLGAIAKGQTQISNALIAEDTLAAIDCIKKMGACVEILNNTIKITGVERINDGQEYDCKNSGTLARLLIGILSGANVNATVVGDGSLSKRPMARVCEPLIKRGANIEYNGSTLPVKIRPATLNDFCFDMTVDSAQVKSAILLSGVTSGKKTVVKEKNPTRDHTEKMINIFGGKALVNGKIITVENTQLKGACVFVPNDPSSAAYYLTLGLLLGEVTVKKVLITALRAGFYEKLRQSGAIIKYENEVQSELGLIADITACKSKINYFEVDQTEIPSMIDELPLLAVIASKNQGCKIMNAVELRNKESDRLAQIIRLICLSGGQAVESFNNLTVERSLQELNFSYESDDHRMIMSAFVLASATNGAIINGEECVNISFPDFFKNYNQLPLGLIGEDLSKSKSGVVHKHILNAFGVENFTYEHYSFSSGKFGEFIQKPRYKAFNATIPYKKDLFFSFNNSSERAKKSYSANYCLGGMVYTTDGEGLILALDYYGVQVANKNVLIYGCGGAGRSVALSLIEKGANVYVINRTQKTAQEFCERLPSVKLYDGQVCDILINATSVKNESLFTQEQIGEARAVIDVNYGVKSELNAYCQSIGKPFYDGKAMLFFQAYVSDCILLNEKILQKQAFALYNDYLVKYEN